MCDPDENLIENCIYFCEETHPELIIALSSF